MNDRAQNMPKSVLAKSSLWLLLLEDRNIRRRLFKFFSLSPPTSDTTSTSLQRPPPPPPAPRRGHRTSLVHFSNDDHLLSTSLLRARVIAALYPAPAILVSCGSRLLILQLRPCSARAPPHADLPLHRGAPFQTPASTSLLCVLFVPQSDDALLHDETIHVSMHDGAHAFHVALTRTPGAPVWVGCERSVRRCRERE